MAKRINNEYGNTLKIDETKTKIILTFSLNKEIIPTEFYLKSKLTGNIVKFDIFKKNGEYCVVLRHDELKKIHLYKANEALLEQYELISNDEYVEYFDCCIRLKSSAEIVGEIIDIDAEKGNGYFFGEFQRIIIGEKQENNKLCLSSDSDKLLKLMINCDMEAFFIQEITKVKLNKGRYHLEGNIATNRKVKDIRLQLQGRDHFEIYRIPVELKDVEEVEKKVYKVNYKVDFDFKEIVTDDFIPDTYGIYIAMSDEFYEEYIVRQKRMKFIQRLRINKFSVTDQEKTFNFTPLFSFKGKVLSLQVDDFKKENYSFLQKKIKTRFLDRFINRKRDIWLVSERIYKAQDNGYYFFKYMRENFPDKEVYYVIDENSKEVKNVKDLGNVVYYKSKEHIELVMLARKFVSTHHYEYMLPLRDKKFKKKLRGATVFLQHGVMGTKYMANLYGNHLSSFRADSFIVSSKKEQDYIVSDFGYKRERTHITGLARYDNLFVETKVKKQIAVIPTWRDWLQNVNNFLESEYFKRYTDLINDERLIKKCQDNEIDLVFCLHPNMQQYTHLFKSDYVKIVFQGMVDVQTLLKESAMLVTDYSSVGFDFSFLNKPLIYYMFDQDDFFKNDGSHLDIANDLAGRIVSHESTLIEEIEYYIDNGFEMKEKYVKRANEFVKYKDLNNAKRIMAVVQATKKDSSIKTKLKKSAALRLLYGAFRKNKRYTPIMKRLVKLMRKLPMKSDLIVIESGMGQIYGDSPKLLYNELKKQKPELKKVIVSDFLVPGLDENTIRVERLSFMYFYYLCVAKYWINNQNYPFYIKRRKNGIYVQTWHGTPLKKMLFDLKKIYGRDSGYKDRTTQAIQQWSHLLSPNSYATEHFRTAFKHNADVLELGYPRNDILYTNNNNDYIIQVKDKLGIEANKKVILYAPTFRDDNMVSRGKFNHALELDFKKTAASLGDDIILLVRLHLVVSSELDIPQEYGEKIIDVSHYQSLEDLLLVSDMLITDYSSVFFDYLNLEKPIIFYAYDLEKYQDELRGFYLNYSEDNLPGPIVKTENALYPMLKNIDKIKHDNIERIKNNKKLYCLNDDESSAQRIISKIFK